MLLHWLPLFLFGLVPSQLPELPPWVTGALMSALTMLSALAPKLSLCQACPGLQAQVCSETVAEKSQSR
jgi:hypothetical protein